MQIKNNYNVRWVKQTQGQKRDVGFSRGPRLANAGQAMKAACMEGLGVFNGDMGIIEDIDNEREIITIV